MLSPSSHCAEGPSSLSSSLRYSGESCDRKLQSSSGSFRSVNSGSLAVDADKCTRSSGPELDELRTRVNHIEEDLTDSLNILTDRINLLELRLSETTDELRAEHRSSHDSLRRTLTDIAKRIVNFIRQTLMKPRRFAQSRTGMGGNRPVITALHE